MHKSAIFVEIRGALGMSQNPLFSPTSVVNNTLKSPGYLSYYPSNCVYKIPIPRGMALKIYFQFFDLPNFGPVCR